MTVSSPTSTAATSDSSLDTRLAHGEHAAFEALIRQYNRRLFRVARSILRDDADAEDAVQDAYFQAYRHMQDFRGRSKLGTWLTRIVINQALMRLRRHKRDRSVISFNAREAGLRRGLDPDSSSVPDDSAESPPVTTLRAEVRSILERRIDELPTAFRAVFVMREVEEMSTQETAECLGIPEATVRSRHFRARALLRSSLSRDLEGVTSDLFGFAGERCDRVVAAVLARLPPGERRAPGAHQKGHEQE